MNDLRLLLLSIGVLLIAGIYLWETIKQKRELRSKIENYPSFSRAGVKTMEINPDDTDDADYSGAISDFNSFLSESRKPVEMTDHLTTHDDETGEISEEDNEDVIEDKVENILVLYVTARGSNLIRGPELLEALESADLHFGKMNIFHFYSNNDPNDLAQPLFSIANLHEPGDFDPDNMEEFSTHGIALFMCLPSVMEGEIIFELMLATAEKLADSLDGEIRDKDHNLLGRTVINRMQDIARRY